MGDKRTVMLHSLMPRTPSLTLYNELNPLKLRMNDSAADLLAVLVDTLLATVVRSH